MKQLISAMQTGDLDTNAYFAIFGGNNAVHSTDIGRTVWPVTGTFQNLVVANDLDGVVWTLFIDEVATALSATTNSRLGVDTVHTVSVTAGQAVVFKRVGTSKFEWEGYPVSTVLEFNSADTRTSAYGMNLYYGAAEGVGGALGATFWSGIASPSGTRSVAAIAGTITRFYVGVIYPFGYVDATTGVRIFLMIDGVLQDGTGGTPDTHLDVMATAADTLLTANRTGLTVPVTRGQLVEFAKEPINGIVAPLISGGSVAFSATTAGQFHVCGSNQPVGISLAAPLYGSVAGYWRTAEDGPSVPIGFVVNGSYNVGGINPMTLTGLIVHGTNTIGPLTQTLALRRNFANPANQPTLTILQTDTGVVADNDATHTVDVSFGDTWDTKASVTAGAGTTSQYHWSYAASMVSTTPTTVRYPTRRVRQFALPISEDNHWLFLRSLEFLMQMGVGLTEGQGSDPQVMIQISRDYGKTWGPERWASAGKIGQYSNRVVFHRLGRFRSGGYVRVAVSDPVQWAFLSCLADLEEGTS